MRNRARDAHLLHSLPAHHRPAAGHHHAAAAFAHEAPMPPPAAHIRVPAGFAAVPVRPDMGQLVETRPSLAARFTSRFPFPISFNSRPAAAAAAAAKIASTYDLVEPMRFLYVSVVKIRGLPGSADDSRVFAELRLGNYTGKTHAAFVAGDGEASLGQVFAFSSSHLQSNLLEVTVRIASALGDAVVGRVAFELADVPLRVPPDSPLAPQWHRLESAGAAAAWHPRGEIMLAVWLGTQADEAFPDAWHSDAHAAPPNALPHTRAKVYFSPRLAYLRVQAAGAQDLVVAANGDAPRPPTAATLRLQLGSQLRLTRVGAPPGSPNPVWNEEFLFVVAEPFDDQLVITAEDRGKPIARTIIPLSAATERHNHINGKPVDPKWFSLSFPGDGGIANGVHFSSKIQLRLSLDFGYHVLEESTHYSSDLQPASKLLRKPRIGILEIGVLSARNLMPMKAHNGGGSTDAYCVAKYGAKWVRTRTVIGTLNPQWNEQYTWEVFDPSTVVTVAVFDNHQLAGGEGRNGGDQRIGKVRVRLSTLEAGRVYTHFYPLLVLQPSGLKNAGELHLAVRFTCTAWVNMVALYARPLLPKMHYTHPVSVQQIDYLRHHAAQAVAARLGRAEPPLRKEVVEYVLDVDAHMFSLRRSKANFYRVMTLFAGVAATVRWLDGVRSWRNPITTVLVHLLAFVLLYFPELILPTVFFYMFLVGVVNFRRRPTQPPHMDTKLSQADMAHPDELDEEFDTFPTTRSPEVIRLRYDRLRNVAGRVQAVAGDLATQGERAQALLSWRDPRATAIFLCFALAGAVVLYVTPVQALMAVATVYGLRHPRFRSRLPSATFNFYRRLPAKSDMLL